MPISIFIDTFCKHFSWGNRIKVAKCFPFLYSIIYGYYKDNRLMVQKTDLFIPKKKKRKLKKTTEQKSFGGFGRGTRT